MCLAWCGTLSLLVQSWTTAFGARWKWPCAPSSMSLFMIRCVEARPVLRFPLISCKSIHHGTTVVMVAASVMACIRQGFPWRWGLMALIAVGGGCTYRPVRVSAMRSLSCFILRWRW
ncbi:hypothetical protein F5148DRAFT_336692 [Russula earlei]|uniref:Uncharacterized protein n=1 Tax=Russula earlei TaxID=71964 RepID=A0ACC0U3V6_9AGAM|nr:hypothetical protein F5148DRAFT_336692 [Russula earlei]